MTARALSLSRLAIARRLAEAQSASLRYEPRAGGGSVFTYSFPAVEFTQDGD